jgi:membrane protein DedA with SNARE-associated domain
MNILNALLSYVLLYKYWTIGLVVYSSALILPLPANAMLLAVGAFSSQGYFSFWLAFAIAAVANTLGDCSGYAITRRYGAVVIHALRLDRVKFFNQLQEELREDAAITVFTTRFASSLSVVGNFLAGLVKVPFKIFFVNDFLGNLIEPFVVLSIGYLVGDYWNNFSNLLEIIAAIIAVGVVIFVLWRMYRRMMRRLDRN